MENCITPEASWSMAVALMQQAVGVSDPNPRVGCVLTNAQGQLIGQGHTQQAGGPHAEVMALRDAQAKGAAIQGATAYVTLEPCAHTGRTPPCADALVAAQVARVVVALPDPNPMVAGQGLARLQAAGIAVEMLPLHHPAAMASRAWNIGFLSRMVRKRPWVRLKMAASADGRTALPDGRSQWITSESARADGHVWRARAGAILTGIGTVLADNPRLDVRGVPVQRQPWRVVLDSQWRTPPQAALLQGGSEVWLVGLADVDAPAQARQAALKAAGAHIITLPAAPSGQHLDLQTLMPLLAERGVNELHVEAGAQLNGALLAGGWADECLLYLAPKWLGEGRGLVDLLPQQYPHDLKALPTWAWQEATLVNDNVRLVARRIGADSF